MTTKKVIVLTGLSGTGKSDLSRQLATQLGFARIGMSEFFLQQAKANGYKDLKEFNQKQGMQKTYFRLLPAFLAEIARQAEQRPGIIIDGIYDPVLYEQIKNQFRGNQIFLFNVCSTRRARLHWLKKREGENNKNAKQERDQNKKNFGVEALLTHPNAIPVRVISIPLAVNQIIQMFQNQMPKTNAKRIKNYLVLKQKAKKRRNALKHK